MPLKASSRQAALVAQSQTNKTKASADGQASASTPVAAQSLTNSKRWAVISASRNEDNDFRLAIKDMSRANSYICIYRLPFAGGGGLGDDEDEEGDEVSDDDEDSDCDEPEPSLDGDKPKCHGREKWICQNQRPDGRVGRQSVTATH